MTNHFVFVYGTLKQGKGNNWILAKAGYKEAHFVRPDQVYGRMFNLGSYPAVTEGTDAIHGEIWRVSNPMLERLDQFEGVPHLYSRLATRTFNGTKCWIYMMPGLYKNQKTPRKATYIPSGIWE